MFPIRNVKGEYIGFGGRVLGDEKPKYLNSPETPVFSKGRELYGLFEARAAFRQHGYALVTEGYMDVVALAQLGFPNTVATLGTACTPEHVQKLFRFTESVVFSAVPEGALKRQLLTEIAETVQLAATELTELWGMANAPRFQPRQERQEHRDHDDAPLPPSYDWDDGSPPRTEERRYGKKSFSRRSQNAPQSSPRGRIQPPSRPDIAARRLLSRMTELDALPHEVHEMLCNLPGDHGQLFGWLDSQLHEHGAQPWAALREGLRGQPFEALAERVMTGPDGGPIEDTEGEEAIDAARELRNVLDFMLDDLLKARQSEAIAAVGTDPLALERYKALEARRLEIRHRLKPSTGGM
jgi:DNA primase